MGLGRPNSLPEAQSEPDPRTAPRIWPEPGCISSYNSHQNSPAQGHLISRSSQRVCRLLPHPRTLDPLVSQLLFPHPPPGCDPRGRCLASLQQQRSESYLLHEHRPSQLQMGVFTGGRFLFRRAVISTTKSRAHRNNAQRKGT